MYSAYAEWLEINSSINSAFEEFYNIFSSLEPGGRDLIVPFACHLYNVKTSFIHMDDAPFPSTLLSNYNRCRLRCKRYDKCVYRRNYAHRFDNADIRRRIIFRAYCRRIPSFHVYTEIFDTPRLSFFFAVLLVHFSHWETPLKFRYSTHFANFLNCSMPILLLSMVHIRFDCIVP